MRKMTDSNMPVGRLARVKDFLPPPSELEVPSDNIKVTLALTRRSVEFFQQQARRNHTKYQRMLRELVDKYAVHYMGARV